MPVKPSRLTTAERNELRARLHQVGAALARVDAPDYGYCEDCGRGIALSRLMAEPLARRCTRCEEGGAVAPVSPGTAQ